MWEEEGKRGKEEGGDNGCKTMEIEKTRVQKSHADQMTHISLCEDGTQSSPLFIDSKSGIPLTQNHGLNSGPLLL